jgi:NADH-quinone oxidoreductase subunit K/NAD(P)H-quinone oxidoreductase subunit 4L
MTFDQLTIYLLAAIALFSVGLYGLLERRNLIRILMSIELMLNAASINFLAFNRFTAPDQAVGQVLVLFVIGLAAAEAAIGLSIILALYRWLHSINIERVRQLKG